ncbi:coiled-coil domain-containing protein 92 [Carcharodon carcharias]|uniref:coiled-coil domain-containing protein 92 n=1 Tax=Carcharodon carcharias TaxID=13397 RepID=UPI001B7EC70B|nr:coiled-coil domain-containing protein 92 [Carcharodon carcharias]
METSSLERQLQSVQRNIAFLKGEHMDLLHGLHMEILQLQKRCTELTYELTLKSSKSGQSDDCEQQEDCAPLEAQIREKELQNAALRKELCHKEALITALEDSLRRRERLFLEELKRRSHRMTLLNSELQKQSETAAHLSFQLHSFKQKLSNSRQGNRPSDKPSDKAIPTSPVYTSISLKRNHKVHSKMTDKTCTDRAMGTGSSQQRRRVAQDELDPMPDPALFLRARWHYGQRQNQVSRPAVPVSQECGLESASLAAALQTPRTVPEGSSKSSNILGPPAETEIPLTDEESAGEDLQKARESFRK